MLRLFSVRVAECPPALETAVYSVLTYVYFVRVINLCMPFFPFSFETRV